MGGFGILALANSISLWPLYTCTIMDFQNPTPTGMSLH